MKIATKLGMLTELAVREFGQAEKLERQPPFDEYQALMNPRHARQAREDGERLMVPPEPLVGDKTTELVPGYEPEETLEPLRADFLDTLADPTTISVDASEHRTHMAARAGVLAPALDAAVSAQATNSIEKMLCHQMAAVHMAGMELLVRLEEAVRVPPLPPGETARLTNAVARLFEVYQSGCLTLHKLKTGGTQRIIVQQQQVNVANGGQAVVAGSLNRGSRNRGKGRKNGQ